MITLIKKSLWRGRSATGRVAPIEAPLWTPPRNLLVFPSGHYTSSGLAPPALVTGQHANGAATNAGTVSATWPATTTNGNLLIAIVANQHNSAVPAITTLAGWTLGISSTCDTGSTGRIRLGIYYIAAASAQSGAVTFTGDQFMSVSLKGIVILEYAWAGATVTTDQTATNSNTSSLATSCDAGTTSATTQAVELAISGCTGASALSTSSTGWSIQDQTSGIALVVGGSHRILSATAAQNMACTYSTPFQNCGAICTFKGA